MITPELIPPIVYNLPHSIEITAENIAKAEELKQKANVHFKNGLIEEAVNLYSDAIAQNPKSAALYCNRSLANFKLEFYLYSLNDAQESINIDSTFVKGYYRKASAHMALGQLKEAMIDFRKVVEIAPQDPQARQKLILCSKEFKRIEFEKAIFVEQIQKSAIDLIGDVDSIVVPNDYDGPHLEGDQVTMQFVIELMAHLKAKKLLHKKYCYKMLLASKAYLTSRPTIEDIVVKPNAKITVCGDIHGQYYDLLNIFQLNGLPSTENMYLFNGDFVDRGSFSVECMLVLLAFKLLLPDSFYLSRGNHETDDMNKVYGFEGEVKAKYTDATFRLFSEIFNAVFRGLTTRFH